ncbi:MAG: rod shape-determining protein RodA [Xanthomonadales bacterium]|nr:rod shape-determining protein RodA [Xanthomonadales bacterium]
MTPALRIPGFLLRRPSADGSLVGALLILVGLGLVVLYSATEADSGSVVRQGIRFGVGAVVLVVFSQVPPQMLRNWTPAAYLVSVVMLMVVAILGEGRGAQRWLDLGFVRFQPSELMKLSLPMMLAWYLHRRQLPPRWIELGVCLFLIAIPAGLIVRQPDLGTALLVGVSGVFVLFLAGLSWRIIGLLAALGAAASPVLWHFMHDYQRARVLTLLNPEGDPLGRGWNIIQSKVAVGSGGLYGKGWQNGTQAHLDFLPESSTDFILAVLAEEFGLVGVLILFGIYLFIIFRCLTIATLAKDTYGRLLAGALTMTFFVYVAVNAGMISGLLPVVGVPLPLVSYGGTSIVSLMAGFGIIMSIYGHRRFLKSR